MNIIKKITKLILIVSICSFCYITASAEGIEDYLNNVVGPDKQYDTYLSSPYLKTMMTEENINHRNGDLSISQTDYVLPGRNGLDLEIRRIYKSSAANMGNMKVKYVDGAWVDYVESDINTSGFYEERYNLGVGMRFSFETLEIPDKENKTILFHTETGDVYTLREYLLDSNDKEEWFKNGIESTLSNTDKIFLPRGDNAKEVYLAYSTNYSNGNETSKYVLVKKDGMKIYFCEDGRILAKKDRFDNTLKFNYTTLKYTIDGKEITRKLINEITDTIGRKVTIAYQEDHNFKVKGISSNTKKDKSYKEMQNPNTTNSGDLEGKYKVTITLPTNEKIVYEKSAALVNDKKEILRTRLQTVYDMDNQAKYHYWYEQPSLGFTYNDGTKFSVFNRYEYLVQVDYCKTNEIRKYTYETFKKKLYKGSMEYRKIFKREKCTKNSYNVATEDFLDRFNLDVKERETFKYTNEPDGFGIEEYKPSNNAYLKDTYRYNVEITDMLGSKVTKTYDGLHELLVTEKLGKDHKEIMRTSHDDLRLINKKIVEKFIMKDGQALYGPITEIENYKYDKYGNLINYTGLDANRDEQGELLDQENTVTYVYDYDKYHSMKLKTLKQDKDKTNQTQNVLDDKGNISRSIIKLDDKDIIKEYVYDTYGNITAEKDIADNSTYTTYYEYGVDAKGSDFKGVYLTKKYTIVNGVKHENTYAYDRKGQLIYSEDPNGNINKHEYDVLGRLTVDTLPDLSTIEYTYQEDPFSNMTVVVKDQKGNRYRHVYDVSGKELEASYYNKDSWQKQHANEYDTYGRKTQSIDANGNKTTYDYTSDNKIAKKTFYEGNIPKESVVFQYKINKENNHYETHMIDEDGYEHRFYYDIKNQLVKVETTPDNKTYYTKKYQYDYLGNKILSTDFKDNQTKYNYDKTGRLIEVIDPMGYSTRYVYNTANLLIRKIEPDNKITTYKYDEEKRIIEQKVYLEGEQETYYITNKYDKSGNLLEKTTGKEDGNKKETSQKIEYNYNNLNQITDEIHHINESDTNIFTYKYDKNGNKIEEKNYITKDKTKYFVNAYQYDLLENVIQENQALFEDGQTKQEGIIKYTYDNNQNLLSKSQLTEQGFITENYSYDYKNRLSKKVIPQNDKVDRTVTFTYDNRGNITAEKISDGSNDYITSYKYDGLNNKTQIIDTTGSITRFQYDENSNLTKTVDARYIGYEMNEAPGTINQYDKNNRLIRTSILEHGETKTISLYEYDGRNNITKKINSLGYNIQNPESSIGDVFTYNALNLLKTKQTAQNINNNVKKPYQYTYNGNGFLIEEINPKGHKKTNEYDYEGKLTKITYEDQTNIKYNYDLTGKRWTEQTDQMGNITTIKYNLYNAEQEKILPDNSKITITYTPDGKIKQQLHSSGSKTLYSYDYAGNIIEEKTLVDQTGSKEVYKQTINKYDIKNLPFETTMYELTLDKTSKTEKQSQAKYKYINTYDKLGRKIKIQEPEDKETIIIYDKIGNVTTVKKKIEDNKYQITRSSYNLQNMVINKSLLLSSDYLDKKALVEGEFDQEYGAKILSAVSFKYDPQGNIVETKDQLGNKTTYTYNLSSKIVSITNPLENKILYNYDELDNMIEQTTPLGNIATYEYDEKGRIVKKINTFGDNETSTISYEYDERGQLIKQINPEQQTSQKGIVYKYDKLSRNTEIYDVQGNLIIKNTYDQQGNLIKKEEGTNIGKDKAYTYIYDLIGHVKTITDPLDNTTTIKYDILGNILQKQDAKGSLINYIYNKDNTLGKIEYPEGITETYTYDRLGRITSKQDAPGNKTIYEYNNFNKIVKQTDPLGNTKTLKYDLKGQVVETIDQLGTKSTIEYNPIGKVIKKEIPLQKEGADTTYYVEDYLYNEDNKLVSKTTYEKQTQKDLRNITYTYYKDGRIKTVTRTGGACTHYTYDKNGNAVKEMTTFKEGSTRILERNYDNNNRLIQKTNYIDKNALQEVPSKLIDPKYPDKIKSITKYEYDILGNLIKEEMPKATYYDETSPEKEKYIIRYNYDALNRLTKKTYKNNNKDVNITIVYDELGNKKQETDEKGNIITYEYTKNNKLKKSTDAKGNSLTFQYDKALNLTEQTNSEGQQITYKYDKLKRLIQTINPSEVVIETKTYDAKGNLLSTTDALGNKTTYTYDLAGRLTTITNPETEEAGKEYTKKITYNIYSQKTSMTNALNETTKYTYDQQGQLITVTDAKGITTTYSYNDTGDKISQIDGNRRETKYTYSQNGHLLMVTDPLGQTIKYTYDITGNILQEKDKKGQHINYTYDNLNRLLRKEIQETTEQITYEYDELGNRTKMNDQTGTTTYTYDQNNQLLQKDKDGTTQIKYTYDTIGNITTTIVQGETTTYTYDNENRMKTVTYGGKTTTYTYDKVGRRQSITYPNDVTIKYTYNKINKITKITNKKGSKELSTITYEYDLAGRKTKKQNHIGITTYTYDKAGRLTKEIAPGYTNTYRYDSNGNRIIQQSYYKQPQNTSFIHTQTNEKITYSTKKTYYIYNENNQLIRTTEKMYDEQEKEQLSKKVTMIYDKNGNQTSTYASYNHPHTITMNQKINAVSIKEEEKEQISTLINRTINTYDGFDRLTKIEKTEDGQKNIITYTYNGDDLRTTKTTKTSKENYKTKVTNYTYDRQHVILEKNEEDKKTYYIRGINYIAKKQETTSYYLYNGHGDVIQTVDSSGNIQNQYTYDAFGKEIFTHEQEENQIRYAGEFYDKEAGLYYLRARYYNPYTGRFLSEDSYWGEEENPASLNLYTYCSNDPVNYIDPSGHWQQGDEKLSVYAQRRLKRLTDEYYGAKNKTQRDAIHRKAEAIRNNSNNHRKNNTSYNSSFSRTANKSIRTSNHIDSKGNRYVTASTWKANSVKHNRRTGGNAQYTNNFKYLYGNREKSTQQLTEAINNDIEKEANHLSDYKVSDSSSPINIIKDVVTGNKTKEYQEEMAQLKDELKKANTSEEEIEEILESQICLDTSYAGGASLAEAIKLDKKRKANKEWEAWEATPRETRELYRLFEYMNRWNHARHLMEDYDEKAYNKLTIELKGMQTLLLGNTILKHDEEGYKLLSETIKDHKTLSNSDIETLKSILKKNNSIVRSDFNKYHKEDIDDFIQQVASVGMIICTGYSFYSMTNQMSINISYNPNFVKTMEDANTGQSMVTAIEWPLSLEAVGITEAEIGMLIEANKENVVAAINAITSGGGMPPQEKRNVEVSKSAQRTAKKLSPEAKKGYDKALEALRSGDTRGLNDHALKGDRKGQWAVDIKGTGRGRGAGRVVYEKLSDGSIEVIEILTNHNY